MARRSEHSLEEIKAMVLSAAENIVAEQGGSALTMRRIASEVGYTVGSIYMVFANMADLITHINARTLEQIALQLDAAQSAEPQQPADICVEQLAKTYLSYAGNHYHRWSLIFDYKLPEDFVLPDSYIQQIEAIFVRVENQFARLSPDCADADKRRAARALWGGIHGICLLSLTGKMDVVGLDDVEASVVLLVRSFMRGWIASPT
ncbi:TetR family transcriptional regulator [Methylosoma difficile]